MQTATLPIPAAAGTAPLIDIHVFGTPRPKGSLRHVGNGRMVEQLKHSPDWRRAVVEDAHKAIACVCGDPDCHTLLPGYPFEGAVEVLISLYFAKPKSAPKTRPILPTSRATGDADKHARNIFDALQDAGVIKDDSQVVDHHVSKRYCRPGETPGARIAVRPVDPEVAR
ncbi:RusA family crossover junction endodeoxyribonuclease [Micromonospora sp. ATA32]|nr:RusA family crossover junction endodeoxyribonuclease [Micromonospora sp. ATA32]